MTKELECTILAQLLAEGAFRAAAISSSELQFSLEFRHICETNSCGMYGRSWMCPPHLGPAGELIEKAKSFKTVLVYQTVSSLEDSFDIEGMLAAGKRQNQLAARIQHFIRSLTDEPFLHLGAGGCQLCPRCALLDKEPCRHPDEALGSLEGYCIDVSSLARSGGMKYINGADTVTYFGAIFIN